MMVQAMMLLFIKGSEQMRRFIRCKHLNRVIVIYPDAVPNTKYGWLCDCNRWTKMDIANHEVVGA